MFGHYRGTTTAFLGQYIYEIKALTVRILRTYSTLTKQLQRLLLHLVHFGGSFGPGTEKNRPICCTPPKTIVVTFVGTLVAVPPPNVDNNDGQHQDLFDSTLRGGESPAHM